MGVDETLGQLWAYDLRATTLFAATISVTLAQHLISIGLGHSSVKIYRRLVSFYSSYLDFVLTQPLCSH